MGPHYEEIGEWLRSCRESRNLSQAQVARKLKITPQAVSLIEQGKSQTPLPRLQQYAELVGGDLVVILASPADPRSRLLGRIAALLPTLAPVLYDSLRAWVDLWEVEDNARRAATSKGAESGRLA